MPLLIRLAERARPPVDFMIDGQACRALQGDTILTAVLTQAERLRLSEFEQRARAGFCLMGACQDCWIETETAARLRACSTMVEDGMRILTRARTVQGIDGQPADVQPADVQPADSRATTIAAPIASGIAL